MSDRQQAEAALVSDSRQLEAIVDRASRACCYALDTEFLRERTYWPVVALVQLAWPAQGSEPPGAALLDPLAMDLKPLRRLLEDGAVMVAHAAAQDLAILQRACGALPRALFDTQVAAGFAGFTSVSLGDLSKALRQVDLPKADRLSDWRRRPLTPSQLKYALADVSGLIELAKILSERLDSLGRLEWARSECQEQLSRAGAVFDPERAWWKLRDARSLKGEARGVAQEIAAWRERTAADLDAPVRTVLADLAVSALAHKPPRSVEALERVRGMEGRRLRPELAAGLLEAVERGRSLAPEEIHCPPGDDVPKALRPAVSLMMAWISQIGADQGIDPALLATRSDLAGFVAGDPDCRLASGWRAEMLGEPLRALLEGRAALYFAGDGRLSLEARKYL